jgi:hypothetical protein
MNETSVRRILTGLGIAVFISIAGCGPQPPPAKEKTIKPVEEPVTEPERKPAANTGSVGSVVDYATGETPLRIKNRKIDQIKKIEENQASRYQE